MVSEAGGSRQLMNINYGGPVIILLVLWFPVLFWRFALLSHELLFISFYCVIFPPSSVFLFLSLTCSFPFPLHPIPCLVVFVFKAVCFILPASVCSCVITLWSWPEPVTSNVYLPPVSPCGIFWFCAVLVHCVAFFSDMNHCFWLYFVLALVLLLWFLVFAIPGLYVLCFIKNC